MTQRILLVVLLAGPLAALADTPLYKPSSRSAEPIDITSNAYGFSRSAPRALEIGDIAPDFALPGQAGATVSSRDLRADGPLVLIFYRGHW